MPPPRLAVVCDFKEEGWPSMDLMGEMLAGQLQAQHTREFRASLVRPAMRRWFARVPRVGANLDRLANRFWLYGRHLNGVKTSYDLFHVVDHSYAHLVHRLPAERTGVFFHDLDAFRCLLEPKRDPRPGWFRALARHTLAGVQRAAVVFHLTMEIRNEIERHGLVDPSRLVYAAPGVSPEFTPCEGETPRNEESPFLLHVGSCIPRKRIDVLLAVFAAARASFKDLRLVQVGGSWSPAQRELIERFGIAGAIEQKRGLSRAEIAALYRASSLVLQPSEAEGFGLPVAEALACGARVIASDIPVLREVGGEAAVYRPTGDVAAWAEATTGVLSGALKPPDRATRLAQAGRFSWEEHARVIAEAYQSLLGPPTPRPARSGSDGHPLDQPLGLQAGV